MRVGRHDNLFELGGHSLLVLKVLAAIKAEFGRPIVLAWVFQAPTLARLAALMSQNCADNAWRHLVALREGGDRPRLFCLNGCDSHVHDYLPIAGYIDPSGPASGLQVGSTAEGGNFNESLDVRMEAYEGEMRGVQPMGHHRLCGFSFGGTEAFDLAKRFEDAGEEIVLFLLDACRPPKSLIVQSWLPRMIYMLQANSVFSTAERKLRNLRKRRNLRKLRGLFTYKVHHWVTGKDRDLKYALVRRSMKRIYRPRLDGNNGCKKYVKGRFDVIHMECGHLALIKEPTVKSVVFH
jgi:thioesterase domain-containing protein